MPTRIGASTAASTRAPEKVSTLDTIKSLKLKPGAKPEQLRVISSLEMNTGSKGQSLTLVNNMGTLQLQPKKGPPHELTTVEKRALVQVLEPMMKTAPADVKEVLDTFLDLTGYRTSASEPAKGWAPAGGRGSNRSTTGSREETSIAGGRGSDRSTTGSRAGIYSGGRGS